MHKALFVGIEAGPTHQEDVAEFLRVRWSRSSMSRTRRACASTAF